MPSLITTAPPLPATAPSAFAPLAFLFLTSSRSLPDLGSFCSRGAQIVRKDILARALSMLVVVLVIVVVSVVDAKGERRAAVGVSVMRTAVIVGLLGLVAAASSSGADVLTDNLSSADQGISHPTT
nr:uncharacterized protein LOC127340142 [Lolium perenne]